MTDGERDLFGAVFLAGVLAAGGLLIFVAAVIQWLVP